MNSNVWQKITGQRPPTEPPTAKQYNEAGYPWFDYYDKEQQALPGSAALAGVKSVKETLLAKTGEELSANESVPTPKIIALRAGLSPQQVREAHFS